MVIVSIVVFILGCLSVLMYFAALFGAASSHKKLIEMGGFKIYPLVILLTTVFLGAIGIWIIDWNTISWIR